MLFPVFKDAHPTQRPANVYVRLRVCICIVLLMFYWNTPYSSKTKFEVAKLFKETKVVFFFLFEAVWTKDLH